MLTLLENNKNTITSLNLRNKDIGKNGARALALALGQLRNLTHLNLGENNIGAASAIALAPALAKCPKLKHLDVSSNKICYASAVLLVDCLCDNENSKKLVLIAYEDIDVRWKEYLRQRVQGKKLELDL